MVMSVMRRAAVFFFKAVRPIANIFVSCPDDFFLTVGTMVDTYKKARFREDKSEKGPVPRGAKTVTISPLLLAPGVIR